jgi:exodeoxyribonuclease VII small subunit
VSDSPNSENFPDDVINLETALKELESLVERMEQGDLSLEESLKLFERGIKLTRMCQSALKSAQQKVEVLSVQNEHAKD